LIEPGGQLRIDFEALDRPVGESGESPRGESRDILSIDQGTVEPPQTVGDMIESAAMLEEQGELAAATRMYRAVLSASGPRAEICFHLAELLYLQGDVHAARERYFMAIELDEDYVEARANLGCVLAETGELDLAVAAFQGALEYHRDYPDVHYHLARTLDELGRGDQADIHWHRFLELSPHSPWADEARVRVDGARETDGELTE
jgi:tetratricopeptide (TPR) repeat protein